MKKDALTRKLAASLFAVAVTGGIFYVPYGSAMPMPQPRRGLQPQIIYVSLGDPAHTVCGIIDGIDEDGSVVSGAIYCNGEHVPPDDPRFPRARRTGSWI